MSKMEIQIGGRDTFQPGEEISGTARWELPKNPRWLEVSLFWRTEGEGNQDMSVVERIRFETSSAHGTKDFRLKVPSGPYSFSGSLISIIWWIQLAEIRDRNPVSKRITISPKGREVVYKDQISVPLLNLPERSTAFRMGRSAHLSWARLTSRKYGVVGAIILVLLLLLLAIEIGIDREPLDSKDSKQEISNVPESVKPEKAEINIDKNEISVERQAADSSEGKQETGNTPAAVGPEELVINIDRDFEYVASERSPLGSYTGKQAVGLSNEPYEALKKEPEYRSDQVLYGYIPLGNSNDPNISFAMDISSNNNNPVLYVDTNNNEDLTDDGPPLENARSAPVKLKVFISMEVEVVLASGETIVRPYKIYFWITQSNSPRFSSLCYYTNQISIGEELYIAIAYEWHRQDALYRDSGLWIDLDRDGKLGHDNPEEHFEDGAVITVDGKEYALRLDYP